MNEDRFRTLIREEAATWARREPGRLRAACCAPLASRRPILPRLAMAAAVCGAAVMLFLPPGRRGEHQPVADAPPRARVVVLADAAAIHAALPHIPPPAGPPPPRRLVPDKVIVVAPEVRYESEPGG